MKLFSSKFARGFTLVEVIVATAVFLLFALGVYGAANLVFKIVYLSRLRILETALLSEQLEIVRNLPYESVGITDGAPSGVLPHTTTTVRNGANFLLTATVRNIDDPFDGTITTTPADSAPADYKMVEISAICTNCPQPLGAVSLSTRVAPKVLEASTNNGSLFIRVFDAYGQPLQGASVFVTNTAATPNTVVEDTTNNGGLVGIIDTPTGTMSYQIRVTKDGYSSDYTVVPSASVPTPIHSPATVVSKMITDITFLIDRTGQINLNALSLSCNGIGSIQFNVWGDKLIGITPNVYKYNQTLTTNGSGAAAIANAEWDTYHVAVTGTASYDLWGTIPLLPFDLAPGATQDVYIILRSHSPNSLLVSIKDAGTSLPLSNASARLYGTGFDQTLGTGYGYLRQTDWSGGSGQSAYVNESRYFSDNGNITIDSPAGDVKLRKSGGRYLNSGWLESSTFDFGNGVAYTNLIFSPLSQPPQAGSNSLTFQIATSDSSSPAAWNFTGPDGATSTYYTTTSTIIYSGNDSHRYLRYRAYLNTENTSYTPTLSEAAFTYTNGCTPPGQVFFYGMSAGTYTLDVSKTGYQPSTGDVDISGATQTTVNMSPSE